MPTRAVRSSLAFSGATAVLSLVPLALYLLAAWLLTRQVKRGPGAGGARVGLGPAFWVAVGAFAAHSYVLFEAVRTEQAFSLAITDSASLVGWVVAGTTLLAMTSLRLAALPSVLLVLAGVLAIGTGLLTGFREIHSPQWEVTAHISLAALAAGWLSMAAVSVLVLTWQNNRLRARQPLGLMSLLPPIETTERLLFSALTAGFAVLTLALVTGFFFVYDAVEQHLIHKIALAIVAWLIFAVLLWGRYRFGWRGRQALRFTIGGFVTLALAYFGSKFVLEIVLGEHWG
jgi:ABC-type uncharacterized transport system permease subunit